MYYRTIQTALFVSMFLCFGIIRGHSQALNIVNSTADTLLHVENNGNIGMGTTNPAKKLHIVNIGTAQLRLAQTSTEFVDFYKDGARLFIRLNNSARVSISDEGSTGMGDFTPEARLEVSADGGADDLLMLSSDDDNDGDLFIVKNNGNVGVGTNSPGEKLSVDGVVESTLGGFKFPDGTIQTTGTIRGSITTDLSSIPAGQSMGIIVTVPGAKIGAAVIVNPQGLLTFDLIISWAQVFADDSVIFGVHNGKSSAYNPSNATYLITVLNP